MSVEDIRSNLRDGIIIIGVVRMKSSVNGSRRDTDSVMIEFQGEVIPRKVMIGLMRYMVRDYIPYMTRTNLKLWLKPLS